MIYAGGNSGGGGGFGSFIDFSVGSTPGIYVAVSEPSRIFVPTVLETTTETATATPPSPNDRRDQTPNQAIIPVVGNVWPDWVYQARKDQGLPLWLEGEGPVPPKFNEMITVDFGLQQPDEEEDMGVLGDIYTAVDTVAGGWLPNIGGYGVNPGAGAVFNVPGTQGVPGSFYAQAPPVPSASPIPGAMPVSNSCDDPMRGYVYKKVCGEYRWVKPKRRRRRQLVTQSDARGIATLKGLLGTGKAFDTWIATHG